MQSKAAMQPNTIPTIAPAPSPDEWGSKVDVSKMVVFWLVGRLSASLDSTVVPRDEGALLGVGVRLEEELLESPTV